MLAAAARPEEGLGRGESQLGPRSYTGGFNNMLLTLENAFIGARLTNRTLVIPPSRNERYNWLRIDAALDQEELRQFWPCFVGSDEVRMCPSALAPSSGKRLDLSLSPLARSIARSNRVQKGPRGLSCVLCRGSGGAQLNTAGVGHAAGAGGDDGDGAQAHGRRDRVAQGASSVGLQPRGGHVCCHAAPQRRQLAGTLQAVRHGMERRRC